MTQPVKHRDMLATRLAHKPSELKRLSLLIEYDSEHGLTELGVSECEVARRNGKMTDTQRAYLAGRDGAACAKSSAVDARERFAQDFPHALRDHVRLGWVDCVTSHGAAGANLRVQRAVLDARDRRRREREARGSVG